MLPAGWVLARIEALIGKGGVFTDGDWVESKDQDPNGDVRLIQLADVGDGEYRNRSARFLTRQRAEGLACTFLSRGDVLVARMPDPLGRACIFPGDRRPSVTAVDVCIIRTGDMGPEHRWLMYFINSPAFRSSVAELQSGSTRKRISRRNLASLALPLPPLAEQRRIVAAIDEHLSRHDAAIAALKRVRAALPRYRAAVLKAACEGKLVESSRTSWSVATLAECGEIVTGRTPPTSHKSYYGGEVPFFKPGDLDAGYVVTEAAQYLSTAGAAVARTTPPMSVMVTCIGATIGKVGLTRIAGAFNQQINALIPTEKIDSRYLYYYLASPIGQGLIRSNASATTLPILNKGKFSALVIHIPPRTVQAEIVAEVDRRLSLADAAERAVSAGLARAKRLRQAILKRAFEGKLVPQDPNDEPARGLLERIRAARTSAVESQARRARGRE